MAIKIRVECTECDRVDDYEGEGCFVVVFLSTKDSISFAHHVNMKEVLRVTAMRFAKDRVEEIVQEMDFEKHIKGEG